MAHDVHPQDEVKVREEAQREQREQQAELHLATLLRTELEDQRSDWQQKSDEQSKESWLCLPSGYVNIAIEHGDLVRGFSHQQ